MEAMRPSIYTLSKDALRISGLSLALVGLGRAVSGRTAGIEAEEVPRPFLPWIGRACRQAREEKGVHQVQIAAAIKVNQATIARFEEGTGWPRHPEEVLMAYANELDMDVRLLWLHAFVLWLENEPVLEADSQERIRAALKRLSV